MTDAKDVCHTHNKEHTDEPTVHLRFHLKQINGSTGWLQLFNKSMTCQCDAFSFLDIYQFQHMHMATYKYNGTSLL
jgi:hypothetical protein